MTCVLKTPAGIVLMLMFLTCFPLILSAQKETVLSGYLGIEGGESFSFRLVFSDSAGLINGYSYTWMNGNSEVKAAITGSVDKQAKTLSFRETRILYNKGFQSNVTICLIDAVLQYKSDGSARMFTGAITSNDLTNVSCGRGSLTFPDSEELRTFFSDTPPANSVVQQQAATAEQPATKKSKPLRIVYDTIPAPAIVQKPSGNSVAAKVTAGVEKMYEWNSDTIKLEIWDGGKIDGDLVSVQYNGQMIWAKATLSASKNTFYLPLSGSMDINRIVIVALNEGNEPPNTANLTLWDGAVPHQVIAYNSIGKEAIIKIRRTQ